MAKKQKIWFHGTSHKNAESIKREGFRVGSWFARHMEDAVEFGGPVVFAVKVTFGRTPMRWQACCSNPLPPSIIIREYEIK